MKLSSPLHIALVVALLASLPVQAQIYQYKDASGKTVISDRPPPSGKSPSKTYTAGGSVSNEASAEGSAAAAPKSLAEKDLELKKRQKEQKDAADKAQKESADKALRKDDCDRARRQLQVLESGERVATRDAQGERTFLEDEQRGAEIERTRKYIADNCK